MHDWGHLRLRSLLQREGLLPFNGTVLCGCGAGAAAWDGVSSCLVLLARSDGEGGLA